MVRERERPPTSLSNGNISPSQRLPVWVAFQALDDDVSVFDPPGFSKSAFCISQLPFPRQEHNRLQNDKDNQSHRKSITSRGRSVSQLYPVKVLVRPPDYNSCIDTASIVLLDVRNDGSLTQAATNAHPSLPYFRSGHWLHPERQRSREQNTR
jgi:hypothetical protein